MTEPMSVGHTPGSMAASPFAQQHTPGYSTNPGSVSMVSRECVEKKRRFIFAGLLFLADLPVAWVTVQLCRLGCVAQRRVVLRHNQPICP